ncbi:MAG: transcriptional repressor LexA [bacterium]
MIALAATQLFPKQQALLEYLKNYVRKNGTAPLLVQIKQDLNLRALSTVHQHLEALEKKGYIKRNKKDRTIEFIDQRVSYGSTLFVPLLGYIAAGKPLEAVEQKGVSIEVPKDLYGEKSLFALKVKGDSMIDAHIMDGDTVIVESQINAENGDIVVALLEDYSATLKKFYKEKNGKFRLQPMNDNYKPIITDKLFIQGKLVGVIRKY